MDTHNYVYKRNDSWKKEDRGSKWADGVRVRTSSFVVIVQWDEDKRNWNVWGHLRKIKGTRSYHNLYDIQNMFMHIYLYLGRQERERARHTHVCMIWRHGGMGGLRYMKLVSVATRVESNGSYLVDNLFGSCVCLILICI